MSWILVPEPPFTCSLGLTDILTFFLCRVSTLLKHANFHSYDEIIPALYVLHIGLMTVTAKWCAASRFLWSMLRHGDIHKLVINSFLCSIRNSDNSLVYKTLHSDLY